MGAASPQKVLATFTVDRSVATPVNTYTWAVPNGVKQVRFNVFGATGGAAEDGDLGGNGGEADATFAVEPGQVFEIVVGGAGRAAGINSGGLNGGGSGSIHGGGGGGGSDVRGGSCAATMTCGFVARFLVAGGGGGGGNGGSSAGGAGGGLTGGAGSGAGAGGGGTQTAGGAGGLQGDAPGSFGIGGSSLASSQGGGGGGGWYGGGSSGFSGGGGGSGYISPIALSASFTTGALSAGDGQVVIYKAG